MDPFALLKVWLSSEVEVYPIIMVFMSLFCRAVVLCSPFLYFSDTSDALRSEIVSDLKSCLARGDSTCFRGGSEVNELMVA